MPDCESDVLTTTLCDKELMCIKSHIYSIGADFYHMVHTCAVLRPINVSKWSVESDYICRPENLTDPVAELPPYSHNLLAFLLCLDKPI